MKKILLVISLLLTPGFLLSNSHINENQIDELAQIFVEIDKHRTIKDRVDLYQHLYHSRSNSPINHLKAVSKSAKQSFIDSLVFSKYGLASYRSREFGLLPENQQAEILRLFGSDLVIATISESFLTKDELELKESLGSNDIGGQMNSVRPDAYCLIFASQSGCYRRLGEVCPTWQCPGGSGPIRPDPRPPGYID